MTQFTSAWGFEQKPTPVLAVHCSDHRFQLGFRQFLDERLGLAGNYDALVIPGGPQPLLPMDSLPKYAWVTRKWLRFLVRAHGLERLVLIAHRDCGWYKWLAEQQGTVRDPERRQKQDLRHLRGLLASDLPKLLVELYFAGWDAGGRVTVDWVGD